MAEALLLRGDMQKKLASLRERIANNVLVQEGEKPHENPDKLMKESAGVLDEIEQITVKINSANLANELPDGRSLTAAIANRDTYWIGPSGSRFKSPASVRQDSRNNSLFSRHEFTFALRSRAFSIRDAACR